MSNSITQDMRFLQSLVKYALKHGVTQAAIKYKKHKSYVSRWKNRYDGSLESLRKKSTRPKSHSRAHTQKELDMIHKHKEENPKDSLIDIWCSLRANHGYTRSISSLYRVLKRLGYIKSKKTKKVLHNGVMEPMRFAGEKVQIDVKFVPMSCIKTVYKEKMYQFTAIDEYSRLRYIEAFQDNSSYSAKQFLLNAQEFFESKYNFKILCVQTDNGREFTNRFDKREHLTAFENTLRSLNIRHKLIRPYTPRHNGKVERSHREDQKRFYDEATFSSFNDFCLKLSKHLDYTNNRPMRPLNYLSPAQFLARSA